MERCFSKTKQITCMVTDTIELADISKERRELCLDSENPDRSLDVELQLTGVVNCVGSLTGCIVGIVLVPINVAIATWVLPVSATTFVLGLISYLVGKSGYNKKLLESEETKILEDFFLPEEQMLADKTKQLAINYQEELKGFILKLNDYDKFLTGTTVKKELESLIEMTSSVMEQLSGHPEKSAVLKKFVTCYMPMALKLLSSYQRLDSKKGENKEVIKTMEEIESSLKALEKAFNCILSTLMQDEVFDASSDATVLKSMLERDGLLGSDFEGE